MKKFISAILTLTLLLATFYGCGSNEPKEETTTTTTTTTQEAPTEETSTSEKSTEQETLKDAQIIAKESTKAANPNKKYNAPNNYSSRGNGANYKIKWNDDNSLRIYTCYDECEDSNNYYDVKINDYGEVTSIMHTFDCEDENGKVETVKAEHYLHPKYNEMHQLVQVVEKDGENKETCFTFNYYYNSAGQRVKRSIEGQGDKCSTIYEYKDGNLVKSNHNQFEPTGEDRVYVYKYDLNSSGLVTEVYESITISETSDEMPSSYQWSNCQSFTYEKVTKAQYDFFYNTLIYHIIDSNENVL